MDEYERLMRLKQTPYTLVDGIRVYQCPTMPAKGYENAELEKQRRMNRISKILQTVDA